ncbi:Zn-ribbon domain-containing OB-fold protein [Bordetella sp. BOR01]|uniref:Zn-ribbon domain-containing OB-fold protein n=1 Tax=Bordetella sp. BOR01 TaxID=2854779 RepID=UPI001C477FF0|nr:OB-fold domain-containing protein [Bordetella sp. BOR01]MBV7483561.1 OB-fold domain-containing protein [Bordetella sp. BOR01]
MTSTARPIPQPTDITRPYWDAAAARQLVIQECRACGARQFYPRGFCIGCLSNDLHWLPCSGKGTIYTFTVNHRAANAALKEHLPYVVAAIDLDEGIRMIANILDSPPEAIQMGARVQVIFEALSETIALPQFRIDSQGLDGL